MKRSMVVEATGCHDCLLWENCEQRNGMVLKKYYELKTFHPECPMKEVHDCSNCWHSKNGNSPCPCENDYDVSINWKPLEEVK